ncbi:hypothetical protein MRS76_24580 [Rhizobiaceae bacterium n13]|uniref:Uncharacterized protein n=1 Tax=Ferirhizobium litorale TaxID=2927786 RepID=A0AAE3QHG9_9HYPH|nr:hypothetical protein [Fererhizobium litorale]MDI7865095.1 hypothetical protein [Fererhizobium litorale]MDI7925096.1 hypothetical protein [Fererhizobium litorale]
MGIARSTYYDSPEKPVDDTSIVEAMFAICDEFEFTAIVVWVPRYASRAWSSTTRRSGG